MMESQYSSFGESDGNPTHRESNIFTQTGKAYKSSGFNSWVSDYND